MQRVRACLIFLTALLISANGNAATQTDIYAYTHAGMLSPIVKQALYRVYVPDSNEETVTVIDPLAYKVIETFRTGKNPQHVVPSYDLKTLWVLNDESNSITPINPATGKAGKNIPVDDPYNMYFTPDGKLAIVLCEQRQQLQLRDPQTFRLSSVILLPCRGPNHMEFTVDGHYGIVTCEFSGKLVKVDLFARRVVKTVSLSGGQDPSPKTTGKSDFIVTDDGQVLSPEDADVSTKKSMPQDIRSSADGKIFFVADMMKDGVILVNPDTLAQTGYIHTGVGTHAIYPSRNGKLLYVSNRGCHQIKCGPHGPGSVSVVDPVKKTVVAIWAIPGGGSPDMGNVTADGKELWLSGRYDNEVYVFDTVAGKLTHRIPVGSGPHGLAVWPQPGRYSLGHTGNMR